jgi:hypothetical protein
VRKQFPAAFPDVPHMIEERYAASKYYLYGLHATGAPDVDENNGADF